MKITIFLYSYNHEAFIAEACDAVLDQDCDGDYEIILSDDASSDRTFEIMQAKAEAYRGNHRLVLNRNEKNLGITAHLNKIMAMGSGDWFILCAGDDVSFLNRISVVVRQIQEYPRLMALYSGFEQIDESGRTLGYHGFDRTRPYVTGASGAWNRILFDFFGPIDEPTTAEDVVIPFRAMLLGQLEMLNEPTVKYRLHSNSVSSPTNVDHLNSLKHLIKIKNNLGNAVRQRLRDLDAVGKTIPGEEYARLKTRHEELLELLADQRKKLEKTVALYEACAGERLAFLLGRNAQYKLIERLRLWAKTSRFCLKIHHVFKRQNRPAPQYDPDGAAVLIDHRDLLSDRHDVLIYL